MVSPIIALDLLALVVFSLPRRQTGNHVFNWRPPGTGQAQIVNPSAGDSGLDVAFEKPNNSSGVPSTRPDPQPPRGTPKPPSPVIVPRPVPRPMPGVVLAPGLVLPMPGSPVSGPVPPATRSQNQTVPVVNPPATGKLVNGKCPRPEQYVDENGDCK